MQSRYESGIRDMETKIEELGQEIAFRKERLQKESKETHTIKEQIRAEIAYLDDRADMLKNKQKELDREVILNKKLQSEIDKLDSTI